MRVVRGLNNPRQLTLLPSQGLLVAEAGRGGETEVPSPFTPELFADGDPTDLAAPPGQVTKVAPNGERTIIRVPFPAGLAVDQWNNVYVAAWSVAPADGLVGPDATPVPDSDGQIWRLRF